MTNDNKPFLMGSETEYSVSGRADLVPLAADNLFEFLSAALRRERTWLPDRNAMKGMFLEHGGRLYLDYGAHPEHATPECRTPVQVACYDKAGDCLLSLARDKVLAEHRHWDITLLKTNLDPVDPNRVTFGTHESYTCWVAAEKAAPQLIPHLVSRIVYAGAGALTAHSEGHGFELSQRARHMQQVTGNETTGNRAIFSTRVRKTADYSREGWIRAHLICKDSQRSGFGVYLTFAATGLLFLLINQKRRVGDSLQLEDPLAALKAFSRDPWLKAKATLTDGRSLTALEIQEFYLEECAVAVQQGGFPEWAGAAVDHWGQTLADLKKDPRRLADRLDPYTKLVIYEHELGRAGVTWSELQNALSKLAWLRGECTAEVVEAVLAQDRSKLCEEGRAEFDRVVSLYALSEPRELARLHLAVRMHALDLRYHELGGLYDRLAAGKVRDVVLTPADVDRATRQAPPGGRAAARADCIRDLQKEDWTCDWLYLWQAATGRCIDLRDPFSNARPLRKLARPEDKAGERIDVLERLGEEPVSEPGSRLRESLRARLARLAGAS